MRHIVIYGLSRFTIFFSTSHKRNDFEKKIIEPKCVFWLSLQLLPETFIILRRELRNDKKFYIGLHANYPLFLSDFTESFNFRDICEEYLSIFHENPSSGSRAASCGQTDGYKEANSRSSQFRERA